MSVRKSPQVQFEYMGKQTVSQETVSLRSRRAKLKPAVKRGLEGAISNILSDLGLGELDPDLIENQARIAGLDTAITISNEVVKFKDDVSKQSNSAQSLKDYVVYIQEVKSKNKNRFGIQFFEYRVRVGLPIYHQKRVLRNKRAKKQLANIFDIIDGGRKEISASSPQYVPLFNLTSSGKTKSTAGQRISKQARIKNASTVRNTKYTNVINRVEPRPITSKKMSKGKTKEDYNDPTKTPRFVTVGGKSGFSLKAIPPRNLYKTLINRARRKVGTKNMLYSMVNLTRVDKD